MIQNESSDYAEYIIRKQKKKSFRKNPTGEQSEIPGQAVPGQSAVLPGQ